MNTLFKPKSKKQLIQIFIKNIKEQGAYQNKDKTWSCDNDLNISYILKQLNFNEIPVKFKIVKGNFNCSDNNLTSLKYSPKIIYKSFDCSNNNLTSLKYCPKIIKEYFYCQNNNLTSLKYS